jgi:zinc protease
MRRASRVLPALLCFLLAGLWALSTHATVPAAQEPSHWTAAVERVVLPNGLTVLMLPRGSAPIVSVQALYKFGSRNDPPGMKGAAHYVEHMAFRSTEGIAKADLTNQILRWGGHWNGYTAYDQTTYASAVPSPMLEWTLVVERERMSRVIFSEDEVARERNSVIAELREYEDWPPYTLIDHRLRPVAYVSHPYGSPIMGWIDDLKKVSADELCGFYRRYYAPNNLVLVIVGRFEPAQALALVRKQFADAPATGESPAIRGIEPPQTGSRRVTLTGPGRVSHLEIAVHAPSANEPDFATLLVVDALLANGIIDDRAEAMQGSRLERSLVGTGLATSVSTETEASEYPGLYSIGVEASSAADLSRAEAAVVTTIGELASVSEEEVRRAARHVRSAMMLEADGNAALADLLARFEGLGSYRRLATLERELENVTPSAVKSFAASTLAGSRWNVGVFVPDASAPPASERSAGSAPADHGPPPRRDGTLVPPDISLTTPVLPSPQVERLSNGLTVLALDDATDVASVSIRIEAGARFDPAGRKGTAVMAARMLSAGSTIPGAPPRQTLEAGFRELEGTIAESAFSLDPARANRSVLEIDIRVPRTGLDAAIRLMADRLLHPSYTQPTLDETRRRLREELEGAQDDSMWRAADAAMARLYPGSNPFGLSAEGDVSSLERIAVEDVRAFHERWITPDRTLIAVAGRAPAEAIQAVARTFGGWQAKGEPIRQAMAEPRSPATGGRVHVSLPHKEQASVVVALPGAAPKDDDYVALRALNYLLGETGYAGRLGETLVDTGVAYAVFTTMPRDPQGGPLLIQTNAVDSAEAVTRILRTLTSFVRDGVSDAERREAQGYLLGGLLFRFESSSSAARALADLALMGAPGGWSTFAGKVRALTTADLKRVATAHYDPSRAVVVVAGR